MEREGSMKKYQKAIYVGLPIFLILAISIVMHLSWINNLDSFCQNLVSSIHGLKSWMLKITLLAKPIIDIFWMVLIAAILWLKKLKSYAISLVITLLSADVVGFIIKHIVQRARPIQHLSIDDGFSFPSGHTLGMGILVIWLMMVLLPKIIDKQTTLVWIDALLIIWLIIVMYSRIYVFAHYPTDVFASVSLALTWVGIVQLCLNKAIKKVWHVDLDI